MKTATRKSLFNVRIGDASKGIFGVGSDHVFSIGVKAFSAQDAARKAFRWPVTQGIDEVRVSTSCCSDAPYVHFDRRYDV